MFEVITRHRQGKFWGAVWAWLLKGTAWSSKKHCIGCIGKPERGKVELLVPSGLMGFRV